MKEKCPRFRDAPISGHFDNAVPHNISYRRFRSLSISRIFSSLTIPVGGEFLIVDFNLDLLGLTRKSGLFESIYGSRDGGSFGRLSTDG